MPPQQRKGLLDFSEDGFDLRAHVFRLWGLSMARRGGANIDRAGAPGVAGSFAVGAEPESTTGPAWIGSVPGLKASRITPLPEPRATRPVSASTRTSRMPGGIRNGIAGSSLSAAFMKSRKMGAATEEPVSPTPRVLGASKPTNTPTARSGENPTNQVSRLSLVVPVFPASGFPTARIRRPVPRSTTPSSIETTW